MKIQVKTFATLKKFEPEGATLELDQGATIKDVIEALGIPDEEVRLAFVNGTHAKKDHPVSEDDKVSLFPAVGGG
jgi:sulfur carrier protein ThiS